MNAAYNYYTVAAINKARSNGHVHVLDWWKSSGLKMIHTHDAANDASENGHVAVLDWWFYSGIKYGHTVRAIESASENWHIEVLEWWKDHRKNNRIKLSILHHEDDALSHIIPTVSRF